MHMLLVCFSGEQSLIQVADVTVSSKLGGVKCMIAVVFKQSQTLTFFPTKDEVYVPTP